MVYPRATEEKRGVDNKIMYMGGYERSKPLHNFTLPCLKWGNQRHLRCQKSDESNEESASIPSGGDRKRRSPPSGEADYTGREFKFPKLIGDDGDEDEIGIGKEKRMDDLDKLVEAMGVKSLRASMEENENERRRDSSPVMAAQVEEARPWNLRTRKSAVVSGGNGIRIEERKLSNYSPLRNEIAAKSPKPRGGGSEEKERAKFSLNLSKKEIEDDFLFLVGHRPPRRPKKRPRAVQRDLDLIFPGMCLREVTADAYKVQELPDVGKS